MLCNFVFCYAGREIVNVYSSVVVVRVFRLVSTTTNHIPLHVLTILPASTVTVVSSVITLIAAVVTSTSVIAWAILTTVVRTVLSAVVPAVIVTIVSTVARYTTIPGRVLLAVISGALCIPSPDLVPVAAIVVPIPTVRPIAPPSITAPLATTVSSSVVVPVSRPVAITWPRGMAAWRTPITTPPGFRRLNLNGSSFQLRAVELASCSVSSLRVGKGDKAEPS
mmetsp:Transcript_24016/g.42358  ORF Transcript_24016/g.42358 Transcript_24016/m.42358 type:complete len:223 (-) Transcript_24016:204-872(-)